MIAHTRIPNDRCACRVNSKLTSKLDQPIWNTHHEVVAVTNQKRWTIMNVSQSADVQTTWVRKQIFSSMMRKLPVLHQIHN